jgi:hypothetical protein
MKPTPLHLIVSRLRKMRLEEQISRLRVMVALEKPYSMRRQELEDLLKFKVVRQLKRERAA